MIGFAAGAHRGALVRRPRVAGRDLARAPRGILRAELRGDEARATAGGQRQIDGSRLRRRNSLATWAANSPPRSRSGRGWPPNSTAERQAAAGKLALLQDAEVKLREAFSALSSEALRRNNQSFLELARNSMTEFQQAARLDLDGRHKAIEDLVQPLKDSLGQVDTKLQEVERGRIGSHSALTEQLRSLNQAQQGLQTETGRLVQALRSPNVRGQWGELQLRRVVEAAGCSSTAISI
jgi:hypothetical protein